MLEKAIATALIVLLALFLSNGGFTAGVNHTIERIDRITEVLRGQ